jgi:hypothetical protein
MDRQLGKSSCLQRLKQLGDRGRSLLCACSDAEHRNGLRYRQLSCFACILQHVGWHKSVIKVACKQDKTA